MQVPRQYQLVNYNKHRVDLASKTVLGKRSPMKPRHTSEYQEFLQQSQIIQNSLLFNDIGFDGEDSNVELSQESQFYDYQLLNNSIEPIITRRRKLDQNQVRQNPKNEASEKTFSFKDSLRENSMKKQDKLVV